MLLDKCIGEKIGRSEFEIIGSSPSERVLQRKLRIEENLNGIGELVLNTQVGLGMEEVDQSIRERSLLLIDSLEHVSAHHHRVMVEQGNQDINARRAHCRLRVFYRKSNHGEQAMADEVSKQLGS